MERLSVVIANHDYADYVGAAIASALALRWLDLEVIVVDDGSTDGSLAEIGRFGDHVLILALPNRGQREALNAGYARSTGDVVIFLDSDDVLPPDLPEALDASLTGDVAKAQFRMQRMDADGRPFGHPFPTASPRASTLRRWMIATSAYPTPPGSGNAYARWFLDRLFPIPPEVGDFTDSALLAAAPLLGDVVCLPQVSVGYRQHGRNDSLLALDPSRFGREVRRAQARWRYAQRVSGRHDGDGPLRRSRELLQLRVAAERRTPGEGLDHETPRRLLVDSLFAPIWPGADPLLRRMLISGWCVAVLLAPSGLVSRLLALRWSTSSVSAGSVP